MRQTVFRMPVLLVLGAVVIGVSAVANSYITDIKHARARVAAGSKIAETRCGPIEYADIGEGRPVLVIHGAGGGIDQGLAFAKPLAEHGFRAIAVSRFGYLRSPLPADATPAAQADAYACLLDTLGIKQTAIIGASAGAPSTLQFAIRHPRRTRSMVLVVPLAYAPKTETDKPSEIAGTTEFLFRTALQSDFLFWVGVKLVPGVITKAILATPPNVAEQASKQEQQRVTDMMYQILPVSQRGPGFLNDAKVATTLERYSLERIAAPTLIVSVKDDLFLTYEPAKYTAQHIRGAKFVGFENGGHVWVGHQTEMATRILEHLK